MNYNNCLLFSNSYTILKYVISLHFASKLVDCFLMRLMLDQNQSESVFDRTACYSEKGR